MNKNFNLYNVEELIKLLKICSKNNYSMISTKRTYYDCFELQSNQPISENIGYFLASLLLFQSKAIGEYVFIKIIINDYSDSTNSESKEKFKYIKELDQLTQCLFTYNGQTFHIIDKLIITEDFIGVRVTKYFFEYLSNNIHL
ncbi:hypothetical protein PMX22_04155 [Clostridium butyricum]|uniref:hypothetical protein n=1 Tax=Clostridium butyricum TaxID=1492 RepID=UPI00232DF888|nr:hypothetical protein [Clostridium butyricum]MDB2158987.1 hypothetical protein [Clostridium butyricum]